jgi:hypothetical protein
MTGRFDPGFVDYGGGLKDFMSSFQAERALKKQEDELEQAKARQKRQDTLQGLLTQSTIDYNKQRTAVLPDVTKTKLNASETAKLVAKNKAGAIVTDKQKSLINDFSDWKNDISLDPATAEKEKTFLLNTYSDVLTPEQISAINDAAKNPVGFRKFTTDEERDAAIEANGITKKDGDVNKKALFVEILQKKKMEKQARAVNLVRVKASVDGQNKLLDEDSKGLTDTTNLINTLQNAANIINDPTLQLTTGPLAEVTNTAKLLINKFTGGESLDAEESLKLKKFLQQIGVQDLKLFGGSDSDKELQQALKQNANLNDPKDVIKFLINRRLERTKMVALGKTAAATAFASSDTDMRDNYFELRTSLATASADPFITRDVNGVKSRKGFDSHIRSLQQSEAYRKSTPADRMKRLAYHSAQWVKRANQARKESAANKVKKLNKR